MRYCVGSPAAGLLLLLLASLTGRCVAVYAATQPPPRRASSPRGRAAVYNQFSFHRDVAAAAAFAWLSSGYETELYDVDDALQPVVAAWLPGGVRAAARFDPCRSLYAAVVFVTVDLYAAPDVPLAANASLVAGAARACQGRPPPLLVAVLHSPPSSAHWDPATPGLYDAFLALSPRSTGFLRLHFPAFRARALHPLLTIFPAPGCGCGGGSGGGGGGGGRAGVAVQGKVESRRRDYGAVVAEALRPGGPRFRPLRVVGRGAGAVDGRANLTAAFWAAVRPRPDLPFADFFAEVGGAGALLTLFASDDYLRFKVSSSLGASLITCTPLVVEPRAARAFAFLPPAAVWLQRAGENPFDALERLGGLGAGLPPRLAALDAARARAFVDNAATVARVMAAAGRGGGGGGGGRRRGALPAARLR